MNDIQQWRRMIPTTRARTPAVDHDESDGHGSPTTPKRGLKPKLSSYFTNHAGAGSTLKPETSFASISDVLFTPKLPAWPDEALYPNPDAEGLIDSIMCRLMSDPYDSLDPRFNGMLMHIFEAYRTAGDAKAHLQGQLDAEVNGRHMLLRRLQQAQKQWSEERQEFKAEIKRLELLLAQGDRGLAEVTTARQDSLLRQKQSYRRSQHTNDGLQTIFDILDKSKRYEDKAYSSQRAAFRPRQSSPSAQMRRLSQQLMSKKSMTSIHAGLPLDTPPDAAPSTLAEASMSEVKAGITEVTCAHTGFGSTSQPKTSMSDDTFSTFSCMGDLLPDETHVGGTHMLETATADEELAAIRRIATAIARRRNVDPSTIMPKLVDLFQIRRPLNNSSSPTLGVGNEGLYTPRSVRKDRASTIQKQPSLMAKASGFFQRLKPHANVDTGASFAGNRFSFETGDDSIAVSSPATAVETCRAGTTTAASASSSGERLLRKSVSLSSLSPMPQHTPSMAQRLSPVPQSPTTSAPPPELRRASRIPTPVYSTFSAARPRQEREGSASSLLTAFNHAENGGRSDSSGSIYVSPSASRVESISSELLASKRNLGTMQSSRLLSINATVPRANSSAEAAGRASEYAHYDPDHRENRRRALNSNRMSPFVACSTFRRDSDLSESSKENIRPMANPAGEVEEDDYGSS